MLLPFWLALTATGVFGVPNATVARQVLDAEGLMVNVGLCVGDSRIQVAERACDILVAVGAGAAPAFPDAADIVAHAVAHVAGVSRLGGNWVAIWGPN